MDSRSWLYLSSGLQRGPLREDELRSMIRRGELEPSVLVWTGGMSEWQTADTVLPIYASSDAPAVLPMVATSHPPTPWDAGSVRAALSLGLGVLAVFGLFPFIQLPAAIAGLVLGVRSLSSPKRGLAIVGIVLSSLVLADMVVIVVVYGGMVQRFGLQRVIQEMLPH